MKPYLVTDNVLAFNRDLIGSVTNTTALLPKSLPKPFFGVAFLGGAKLQLVTRVNSYKMTRKIFGDSDESFSVCM